MPHNFYPGQSVVCVDDKVPLEGGVTVKDAQIAEGTVYVVRWCGWAHLYVVGDYYGLKLEGVDSKFGEAWGVPDAPYAARRFRPLEPISIFKAIAADPSHKINAPEGPARGKPVREGVPGRRQKEVVE
jgi:hypothetical protein